MKVKIKSEGEKVTQILIDEHDFTKAPISRIDVCFKGGDNPKLLLEADIDDIEIEGDFKALRKIPEEYTVNVNLNTSDIDIREITKELNRLSNGTLDDFNHINSSNISNTTEVKVEGDLSNVSINAIEDYIINNFNKATCR